ncbi:hypothetical protein RAA17_02600 [Komagataeibacter rhaeticus]|nr:hypothetical protein [Komagataeibacter rhaeticus]
MADTGMLVTLPWREGMTSWPRGATCPGWRAWTAGKSAPVRAGSLSAAIRCM